MGTNYYHHTNICGHCGRGDEPKHIGKSSGGWCFSLHVYPDQGIRTLEDWERIFRGHGTLIKDEYERVISADEMVDVIRNRSWKERSKNTPPTLYTSWDQFHEKNLSEFGPNGLMRHKVDMKYCIGHGEGTWDLLIGEFS